MTSLLAALTAADVLRCPTFWGLLFGSIALWFLLPGAPRRGKVVGGVLGAIAAICLFADLGWLGNYGQQTLFWLLASIALLASVGAITSRSPVYSAVWFALSLLGTSGVFLMQGAQFLGVATIVVYAGAIVVTFLFVLMLAQPEGHATYDRISWGQGPTIVGILAAATLVGLLTHSLADVKSAQAPLVVVEAGSSRANHSVLDRAHMANLGRELFSGQLVAVEIGGTLLLVGLVGAVGMMIQGKLIRQEQET